MPIGPDDLGQPTKPGPRPASTTRGALLTGSIAFDAALGFLGEIGAFGLIVYGILLLFSISAGAWIQPALLGGGAILTGVMMMLHTQTMRKRYPSFARGWQTGRNIWDRIGNQILTLLIGLAVAIVLFPLGMVICTVGVWGGGWGIFAGVVAVYLLGMLARRMHTANKAKKERNRNG